MSDYVIGDVQGCYDALRRLLDHIDFNEQNDCLWFTGDLVNRGPDSLASLRFIKQLPHKHVVLGNHDFHLLAQASGAQPAEAGDSLSEVLRAPDVDELCTWLRGLPLMIHDQALDYVLVHAGIYPWWSLAQATAYAAEVTAAMQDDATYLNFLQHMYGDVPDCWHEDLSGMARLRFITNCFTCMRYCYPNGRLDFKHKQAPGQQPAGLYPWFDLLSAADNMPRILFGHWARLCAQHPRGPQAFALDGGCVWGECLAAMRLQDQQYFTVNCA